MFPGCTTLDMRARQADLLREGQYGPVPARRTRLAIAPWLGRVAHWLLAALVGLRFGGYM